MCCVAYTNGAVLLRCISSCDPESDPLCLSLTPPSTRCATHCSPVWHGGQAVKALTMAAREVNAAFPGHGTIHAGTPSQIDTAGWVRAAELGAGFILDKQIMSGVDKGLIIALEQSPNPDDPSTSTILEALDGLLELGNYTNNGTYTRRAILAAKWVLDNAYMTTGTQPLPQGSYNFSGLLWDIRNVSTHRWDPTYHGNRDTAEPGRPLADDAIMLKAFRLTRNQSYERAFLSTIDRLVKDEAPRGNWGSYGPCTGARGVMHPRQAYWWGMPMIDAYEHTLDSTYLQVANRSALWYQAAQRADGGMFRSTRYDFVTSTFGQVTSGSSCAALLWIRLYRITRDQSLLAPLLAALQFIQGSHFGSGTADSNLRNAVLEYNTPPIAVEGCSCPDRTASSRVERQQGDCISKCNGGAKGGTGGSISDASPYHVRDIATSFYMQALAMLLQGARIEEVETHAARRSHDSQ